ncbi:hybrid sensor histidine kinase/response regulator [Fuscibacter oryzae]|uniref:histidine kinase n=1 Tax=Fuscibacter oryzae TaxID=2803939 RepID=A0A8J7MTD9_9RHOB|nr:PAS domain-containing hybrid sensor histidine kinase/response regulator [Fuscibacter oryzae]MBL4927034.1 PAS domain S-box protein [Fuscibacter oryzae]
MTTGMATTPDAGPAIGQRTALADFAARNSAEGRFRRYARARVRGFAMRQTMTVFGALTIGIFGAPWIGFVAAFTAVLGEAVDCLVLATTLRQVSITARLRRAAAASGAVQAITISACILLCWAKVPYSEARLFAAVFLMSAAINAGLVRHHFAEGSLMRLVVYTLTGLVMTGSIAPGLLHGQASDWFVVLSITILAYVAALFIQAMEHGRQQRLRFEAALLEEQGALEASRSALDQAARLSERLALVARKANDSIIFTTPDGRIEWVNEAFSRVTGYSAAEAVGRMPSDVLNSPLTSDESLQILAGAQQDCRPCLVEIANRTKDGRDIWMEVSMTPVLKPDGRPDVYIAIERDVTQAKAHAAELSAARIAAEAAAQAKAAFLATMSHEIRTPLGGLIGMGELLEDTQLDPQQRQYTATIVESGRALLTILNDVLDLSKLQAGKAELRLEPFSLTESVVRAVDLLRPTAEKKGIALTADCLDGLPRYLGDAGRLRQILLNLMGNAVKFTAEGQVAVSLGVTQLAGHDEIRIAVADTGIGIAPDRIGQVFDSFTQADATISRQFGGTGLGLTISRLLAEQMGGNIEVASVIGEGSVFTLTVRLARAAAAVAAPSRQGVVVPRTSLHVLVAEDNRTNMLIARKLLEPAVARLTQAENGRIAVERYLDQPPDLVLMDVSMPEMDGLSASRAIRAHEAAHGLAPCPIHALTAFAAPEDEAARRAAGIDGVLTKPLSRADLYALIARIAGQAGCEPAPAHGIKTAEQGGRAWSISRRGSTITTGRSTRLSGL